MEKLKLLYLDSAEVGRIASDMYASEAGRKRKASNCVERFHESKYVLFITHHLLQELLALRNDDLVEKRLKFISTLPVVCWPESSTSNRALGGYPDIQALEVIKFLENPSVSYDVCRCELSQKLLSYGSGDQFLSRYLELYLSARDFGLFEVQRVKAIESLSHVAERSIDTLTVSEIMASEFRSKQDIENWFKSYSLLVQKRISNYGDKRLDNTATHATDFVESIVGNMTELFSAEGFDMEGFLAGFGVRADQINDQSTMWEIGQVAIFNAQMKILAEDGILDSNSINNVNPEKIPSWVIWRELNYHMKAESRATGSSASDRYHATFVSYVDKFQCDKRVHHYINISKNGSDPLVRAKAIAFKVKNYSDIEFK